MNKPETSLDNPLLEDWTTPHGLPPFDRIRAEHFEPAFEVAMAQHRRELDAIAAQSRLMMSWIAIARRTLSSVGVVITSS